MAGMTRVFCPFCENYNFHPETHDGRFECSECGNRLTRPAYDLLIKQDREADDDWQREQATQMGMAYGCDGFNDAMGW